MIVVGGGIVGMSIAWRLAQRGLPVEVFDAGRIGGEASWAGGRDARARRGGRLTHALGTPYR